MTQVMLAQRAGISQSAISSFITGRRAPGRELVGTLARVLAVSPEWLLRGGSRRGVAEPMRDPENELSWHERETYGDGSRFYGNARIEVFTPTLPIFVRETGQNSNDAALDESAVLIEYRLGILSGDRLAKFLKAIHWDVLCKHYEAVASDQTHRTTKRYREGLTNLARTGKLAVMRVDDYGTSGLVGDEFEPGAFSALVRNSQDSQKRDLSAGGRFGLGSSVLSATSAFDLVLFSSKLSTPIDGKTDGRTIGRAYFPWHKVSDKEYEGAFYFGKVQQASDERRRLSAWAEESLIQDLWLSRRVSPGVSATGTSALVIGFFDPESGVDSDHAPDTVIAKIADAFVDSFWPAIAHGRVTAIFSQFDNDSLVYERRVDSSNVSHPGVALVDGSPDVMRRDIALHVPRNKETGNGPFDHTARLLVRVVDTDEVSDAHVNEVAMWRRPEMVVRYRPYPSLALGARPFKAALICGEAVGQVGDSIGPPEIAAEVFLAKAEPPQHNSWTADGTDLVEDYRGGRIALQRFEEALRDGLRDATKPVDHSEPEGPPQLRELLAIPSDGAGTQRRAYVSQLGWLDDSLSALVAQVKLSHREGRPFALRPLLSLATDGGGIAVSCTIGEVMGGVAKEDGTIIPAPRSREMRIIVRPDWNETPVRPELTAMTFEVAVQEAESA